MEQPSNGMGWILVVFLGLLWAELFGGTSAEAKGLLSMREIVTLDCEANLHVLAGSALETGVDLSGAIHLVEKLGSQYYEMAQCSCKNLGLEEFRSRFFPLSQVGAERFLKGRLPNETCKKQFSIFTDFAVYRKKLESFLPFEYLPLSETCKENIDGQNECLYSYTLLNQKASLNLAFSTCPLKKHSPKKKWMPYVSLTCSGEGCDELLMPCGNNQACPTNQECQALYPFKFDDMQDPAVQDIYDYITGIGLLDYDKRECNDLSDFYSGIAQWISKTYFNKKDADGKKFNQLKFCVPAMSRTVDNFGGFNFTACNEGNTMWTCGDRLNIDPSACNGNGICRNRDYCECYEGYGGHLCERKEPTKKALPVAKEGKQSSKKAKLFPVLPKLSKRMLGKPQNTQVHETKCGGINADMLATCGGRGYCSDGDYCYCYQGAWDRDDTGVCTINPDQQWDDIGRKCFKSFTEHLGSWDGTLYDKTNVFNAKRMSGHIPVFAKTKILQQDRYYRDAIIPIIRKDCGKPLEFMPSHPFLRTSVNMPLIDGALDIVNEQIFKARKCGNSQWSEEKQRSLIDLYSPQPWLNYFTTPHKSYGSTQDNTPIGKLDFSHSERVKMPKTCNALNYMLTGKCRASYTGFSSMFNDKLTIHLALQKCPSGVPAMALLCEGQPCHQALFPRMCNSDKDCEGKAQCQDLKEKWPEQVNYPWLRLGVWNNYDPCNDDAETEQDKFYRTFLRAIQKLPSDGKTSLKICMPKISLEKWKPVEIDGSEVTVNGLRTYDGPKNPFQPIPGQPDHPLQWLGVLVILFSGSCLGLICMVACACYFGFLGAGAMAVRQKMKSSDYETIQ